MFGVSRRAASAVFLSEACYIAWCPVSSIKVTASTVRMPGCAATLRGGMRAWLASNSSPRCPGSAASPAL
jgi:hypothetical protein